MDCGRAPPGGRTRKPGHPVRPDTRLEFGDDDAGPNTRSVYGLELKRHSSGDDVALGELGEVTDLLLRPPVVATQCLRHQMRDLGRHFDAGARIEQ